MISLGSDGPFTVNMASPFYGYHYEKTREAIQRGVRQGWLKYRGEVFLREIGFKAEKAYTAATLKVKRDWLQHDTMLHYWRRLVPKAKISLGYDCDPKVRADGEGVFSDGLQGAIEMDRETESLSVVLQRLSLHRQHEKDVFFMTLSQARIEKIVKRLHGTGLENRIWFAVWYDLIKRPNVWQDITGKLAQAYPREG